MYRQYKNEKLHCKKANQQKKWKGKWQNGKKGNLLISLVYKQKCAKSTNKTFTKVEIQMAKNYI